MPPCYQISHFLRPDVCPYMSSEHRCAMDLPASNCVWEETSGTCRSNSSEGSFEIGGCQAVDDDDDIGEYCLEILYF